MKLEKAALLLLAIYLISKSSSKPKPELRENVDLLDPSRG